MHYISKFTFYNNLTFLFVYFTAVPLIQYILVES